MYPPQTASQFPTLYVFLFLIPVQVYISLSIPSVLFHLNSYYLCFHFPPSNFFCSQHNPKYIATCFAGVNDYGRKMSHIWEWTTHSILIGWNIHYYLITRGKNYGKRNEKYQACAECRRN